MWQNNIWFYLGLPHIHHSSMVWEKLPRLFCLFTLHQTWTTLWSLEKVAIHSLFHSCNLSSVKHSCLNYPIPLVLIFSQTLYTWESLQLGMCMKQCGQYWCKCINPCLLFRGQREDLRVWQHACMAFRKTYLCDKGVARITGVGHSSGSILVMLDDVIPWNC